MWLLVVSICTSLITVLLFFGSMGRGLLSMCKQSIRKTCRCPATRCYKKPELLGWDPPPPPLNKHNRFQYTVPSHIKSCAGRGVRGKKPGFLERKAYGKESPDYKQGLYAWLWNGHLFILTYYASIKSVEATWAFAGLHPGTPVRPTY